MFRLLFLIFIIALVLAVRYLPWWALLVIPVLLLFGLKYLFTAVFTMPFKAKSRVLQNAGVQVHGVVPAVKPVKVKSGGGSDDDDDEGAEEEEDESSKNRNYFEIDLTITPQPPKGAFQLWEPGELILVKPDTKSGIPKDEDDGEVGTIHKTEIYDAGVFKPDEAGKYEGPQRLKLLAAVDPGVKRAKLRYYFEIIGDISLP